MTTAEPAPVAATLANYAASFDPPQDVRREASRAFLNWVGCALGGSQEQAVDIALASAELTGAGGAASVLGRGVRLDRSSAALTNCLSSSVLAFDDTHLSTVTHPTGPVAAAALAYAEGRPVDGASFLNAIAIGIEVQCRMSLLLLLPPSGASLGIYVTGLTGPMGAAAAVGRLMRLDPAQMTAALGLAATQGAGLRSTHGAMSGAMVPAFAARDGLCAASLASFGFTCPPDVVEGAKGMIELFAPGADPRNGLEGLGERHELFANAYKPYPCGIVIHPAIDAALDVAAGPGSGDAPERVVARVNPLALRLCDRPAPRDVFEAQVSLQHWIAVALLRRRAGVAELDQGTIDAGDVVRLRLRVSAVADASIPREGALLEATFASGERRDAKVRRARGSVERPMTDDELDAKFLSQAERALGVDRARHLLGLCRDLGGSDSLQESLALILA